ncbi:hypothetical protein D8796_10265 [Streptococcus cristatus]|uniref:DUF1361 domain-containing protein n=1 Tax=Streptococcus cristatus TaxID=45634 RepID=A0A428GPW3_STRCR|nr:DUF1361 domain-containing protein [Streptococcus cristatus]RSJ77171.1 hypothetical protein D8795_10050 [Streptococcus cristatus]RSJ77341.1 hypothetical protein D8796_10265 [Streptococcus cristatus]RSJ83449.1 hypothetical protein D8793_10295 [Streptococcus cristatus]RSJ83503.1 hypothetical protein D8794_09980 [Streptococcus cristatus]
MRKPILIHIFFLLIAFVVYIQGITVQGPDLIWNMILALIAYDAAVLTTISKKQKWLYPLLLVVWLAFYPNTFYMLTDLVHMTWVGDTLWNPVSMRLFMAFVPSILFGVYCGIESWNILRERWKWTWWLDMLVVAALSYLSSLAIYIGRYDRLNSWDLVTRPQLVVQKLLETFQKDRLVFILGFTFIQIMTLLFLSRENKK